MLCLLMQFFCFYLRLFFCVYCSTPFSFIEAQVEKAPLDRAPSVSNSEFDSAVPIILEADEGEVLSFKRVTVS